MFFETIYFQTKDMTESQLRKLIAESIQELISEQDLSFNDNIIVEEIPDGINEEDVDSIDNSKEDNAYKIY